MATIKIADIEALSSELSDKDAVVLSGGMCRGGGYPVYDPELGRRVYPDYGTYYASVDKGDFSKPSK